MALDDFDRLIPEAYARSMRVLGKCILRVRVSSLPGSSNREKAIATDVGIGMSGLIPLLRADLQRRVTALLRSERYEASFFGVLACQSWPNHRFLRQKDRLPAAAIASQRSE